MEKNSNWSEISKDINNAKDKIKEKLNSEVSHEDLRESLNDTLDEIKNLFYDIIKTVEETIKDDEIRKETKDVIKKINIELIDTLNIKKSRNNEEDHQEEE
ncbi:MAG: hypothetical protein CBD98_003300 [Flavobacteriaceae bacterium TMED238]|nr:MAG: hypothetical protein CBD98_003300 [Flavobacteriaceae bacterium TMED238]|tara:strand:- start:1281 stop:1583 length:303 start_codon:yes stop_codon:yes gene_type:complete